MRYIVYGAGGIGAAIGASLSDQGHSVILIARGQHFQAMAEKGLRLETPLGVTLHQLPVVDHPSKIDFQPGDVVLLAMKSQDTLAALEDLAAIAPAEVPVICVQNGVENERIALRVFANVYGVMIICPATYLSPGIVNVDSSAKLGIVAIGRYPRGADDLSEQIAKDLAGAGWHSIATDDVQPWKYAKLISGNLSNATQVVLGLDARNGEIARRAREEGEAVLKAAGLEMIPSSEFAGLRSQHVKPGPGDAIRGSSTWQSVARPGSVESDYLNGEVVLLGRLYGVPTPVNELLQRLTNEILWSKRKPGELSEEEFLSLV